MDNDDMTVGRVLTRHEILRLINVTNASTLLTACTPNQPRTGSLAGAATPTSLPTNTSTVTTDATVTTQSLVTNCVVRPEMTEGPLFVDVNLNRSDIRLDPSNNKVSEGAVLDLLFQIASLSQTAYTPLPGAQVDIWQCDAFGIYSDTDQLGMQTVGQEFLRGYQITDESGVVRFRTIYPGWYIERTVHIHIKIRTKSGYEFTSQLYFDDALTDRVFARPPYNTEVRRMRNEQDPIYAEGGPMMMLDPQKTADGYAASFGIALDMT